MVQWPKNRPLDFRSKLNYTKFVVGGLKMTHEGRYWLKRIQEEAANIVEAERREIEAIETLKREALASGRGYTDPRTGMTYFPARH